MSDSVPKHRAAVIYRPGEGYYARCFDCDWQGPVVTEKVIADRQARQHREESP